MKLKDLTPENPKTYNLLVITKHRSMRVCNLKVETIYKPLTYNQTLVDEYLSAMQEAAVETHDGQGLLVVIIHEARYLQTRKLSCNPYVSLLFHGELRKTKESVGCIDIELVHVVEEKHIIDTYKLKGNGELDVELQWRISDQITVNNDN
ncbi:hypothetical protein L1987_57638 [Smallanthus sonchifolius]|uniref:Uncharacterized protein n=1 Tax=Smallanthus sonchifolius TaxID=185202 RepID=A0ACB9DDF2_9ASTR|nr:hypothetical protein L1987_57638 [Smallanthus sonchifolius]